MTNPPKKKLENIFQASAELEKKRHKKEPQGGVEKQNEEIRALFKQCEEMHEDLANRIDRAFERSGMTEGQFRSYLNRPQNFSKKDWEDMQEQRKVNLERLKKLAPKASAQIVKEEVFPQSPESSTPSREVFRKKPITKRRWLKMG